MSPKRKFKLDASVFDDEGADETANIAVPKAKAAENSKIRSVKTTIRDESRVYPVR